MDLAHGLGCSEGHIYRKWKALSGNHRAPRKDRRRRKIAITAEIKEFMFGLTGRADLSAEHVLLIASRHFGLPENFMSTGTYNNWLRQERVSRAENKKDLRPYHTHLWRDKANALHQFDATVALAFYANDDGSIGYEPGHERYKNKPGNRRPRLHLYSLTDYFSSTIFAKFYFSENALNLLDFVFCAWSQKQDSCFPFYGIPDQVYCDQGAPSKSAKFMHALKVLGVDKVKTDPAHWTDSGSRKFGRAERTFGEGLLKEFMKTTLLYCYASIEEMNGALWHWLIRLNNKIHRTHNEPRFARWLRTVGTPRSMPSEEMYKLLHYDRATPTVRNNLQFQLNGKTFQLPYRKPFINWTQAKIEAYWYPGYEEAVSVVYDHHEEEIKALAPVVQMSDPYKTVAKTEREELVERLKTQNYSSINFPAIYTPEKDLPYLPRKGETFDETKIAEKTIVGADLRVRPSFAPERYLSREQAGAWLRVEGFRNKQMSEEEFAWRDALMAGREKIPETELRDAAIVFYRDRTGTEDQ